MLSPSVSQHRRFWTFQIGGWLALIPCFFVLGLMILPALSSWSNSILRQIVGLVIPFA